jgi:major membrane immunogen (membrane-anchored lipoprotein)
MRIFLVIAVAVLLVGCSHRYKVTLTNGNAFTTNSKPKLNKEGSAYTYKDGQGREISIPALRVSEIARQ